MVESLGHKVISFTSPIEALDYVKKNYTDISLILLDLMMPEMYGLNFLKHIKNNPDSSKIVVIVNSCVSDPEEKKHATALGAADFINKPFNKAELETKIKVFL